MKLKHINTEISHLATMEAKNYISNHGLEQLKEFEYLKSLHEEKVKNLSLSGVSNRRELLIDFCTKLELKAKQYSYLIPDEDFIDEYLKDN